jgi:hypothetical protein
MASANGGKFRKPIRSGGGGVPRRSEVQSVYSSRYAPTVSSNFRRIVLWELRAAYEMTLRDFEGNHLW